MHGKNFTAKIKKHISSKTGHEDPEVEWRYSSTLSLTSVLDGVGGQSRSPAVFTPGEDPCIGGWVDPRAGLDGLAPTGIRSLDRPARGESLYQLSYRSSQRVTALPQTFDAT